MHPVPAFQWISSHHEHLIFADSLFRILFPVPFLALPIVFAFIILSEEKISAEEIGVLIFMSAFFVMGIIQLLKWLERLVPRKIHFTGTKTSLTLTDGKEVRNIPWESFTGDMTLIVKKQREDIWTVILELKSRKEIRKGRFAQKEIHLCNIAHVSSISEQIREAVQRKVM